MNTRVTTAAPSPQSRAASTRRPWLVMFLAGQGQPSCRRRSPPADAASPLRRSGGKEDGALIQSLRCISSALGYAQGNVVARKAAVHERVRDVLLPFRKVSHEHSIRHGKRSQQRSLFSVKHGVPLFMRGLGRMFFGDARKNVGGVK